MYVAVAVGVGATTGLEEIHFLSSVLDKGVHLSVELLDDDEVHEVGIWS